MLTFKIVRVANTKHGMFGVLIDSSDVPFAVTLEPEWKNNKKYVSCIPGGAYKCERRLSLKYGETFEVKSVASRGDILFHKGNVSEHTKGCILVGEQFETLNGKPAILHSGKGFGEFMGRLKNEHSFNLVVTRA